jgi:azurin
MYPKKITWILLFALAACSNDTSKNENKPQASAAPVATPPPTVSAAPTASAPPVQHVELQIASVGDTMTYDKSELTAPAKSEVHLVFKNNAKLDVLPHNWVLVHEKTEAKVAADGLARGKEHDYMPENSDDVLASVPLTPPGKTSEVTFTAPKYPGKYPYICTVPGHYVMMKGVLNVTAP